MKLFCLGLIGLMLSTAAFSFPSGYGTQEIYDVKTAKDTNATNISTNTSNISTNTALLANDGGGTASALFSAQKQAIIVFDAADFGQATPFASGATLQSGLTLPAGVVITKVLGSIDEVVSTASDNKLSLGCESASDLVAGIDLSAKADSAVFAGVPTGVAGNALYSDGCEVFFGVGVGGSGITGGRVTFIIDYFLGITGI